MLLTSYFLLFTSLSFSYHLLHLSIQLPLHMPQLTIITTPSSSSLSFPFSLEATTAELKLALAALIEDSGQVSRMVCGGRVLRDELTLEEQGINAE